MEFRDWLLNELAKRVPPIVEDAMGIIWKVIYIPERPEIPYFRETVDLDAVKNLFAPTNWTDFYRWINHHIPAFEPGQSPDNVTAGGVGQCYFFGDHVVKFTDQQDEAEIAALLGDHQIPEVAIQDVVRVRKANMWAIMQERVQINDIPEELKQAAQIVGDYIYDLFQPEKKSPFQGQSPQGAGQAASFLYGQQYGVEGNFVVQAYAEMIMDVIKRIEKKTGRVYFDSGLLNVGMKKIAGKPQPALFDLGYNFATKPKRIPKIREV